MTHPDPWQFPCEFPIKIVGKAGPELEAFVLATLRKHLPDLPEDCLELRPSQANNYLAITVKITATSKEQLDAIYRELSASDLVMMAL